MPFYHDGDDEDGLEEQIGCEADGEPKEYPQDVGDEEDGTDVDREGAQRFFLLYEHELRVVGVDRHDGDH